MKEIPKSTTFHIKVESPMFEQVFEGDFRVHRPTLDEISAISSAVSEANNGQSFTVPEFAGLVLATYELKVIIDESPEWWENIVKNQDSFVIMRVYSEYLEWKKRPFRHQERLRRLEEERKALEEKARQT